MQISKNEITFRTGDNGHCHFRQGELLKFIIKCNIENGWIGRLVAEPNTEPPILTGKEAVNYRQLIIDESARYKFANHDFDIVQTIQITENTTPAMIHDAWLRGIRVCKVYPRYVTTNSANGVVDYEKIYPALKMAEELGMIVQFHPEHPSYSIIGRLKEQSFIETLNRIRAYCPKLKISVEHVSTKAMIDWVLSQPVEYVGASLTVHHMYVTADDLAGYSERSGGKGCVDDALFKPCAKDPEDRQAVIDAATSGDPHFWYGGDDALHTRSNKHCRRSSCGTWNTLAAYPLLISLFEKSGKLEKLELFVSEHWAKFYGFNLNTGTLTFRRYDWLVPKEFPIPGLNDFATPFYSGEILNWNLVSPEFRVR
jgi:dihydroorotase